MRYQTFTPAGSLIGESETAQRAGEHAANWLEGNSESFAYSVDNSPLAVYKFIRHGRMEWPAISWPSSLFDTLEACKKG